MPTLSVLIDPTAWWLVLLPILFVTPVYYLQGHKWTGGVVTVAFSLYIWLAWRIPHSSPIDLGGWTLYLDLTTTYLLTLLAFVMICFAGLILVTVQPQIRREHFLYSLLLLPLLTLVVGSVKLEVSAMVVTLAAILTAYVLHQGGRDTSRMSLRFLVLQSLALPLLLLSAYAVQQYQLGLETAQTSFQLTFFTIGGFSLLLGLIPFQGWIRGLASSTHLVFTGLFFVAFPVVVSLLLLRTLQSLDAVVPKADIQQGLFVIGCLTVFVGGLFASIPRSLQASFGAITVFDLGFVVIGVSTLAENGVILLLTVRVITLLLLSVSLLVMQYQDEPTKQTGNIRPMFIPALGFAVGLGTSIGMPLTIGYVSHWWLIKLISNQAPMWLILLIIGNLGALIGLLRLGQTLLPRQELFYLPKQRSDWAQLLGLQNRDTVSISPFQANANTKFGWFSLHILIVSLILLCVFLGMFPQPLLTLIQQVNEGL
ncbi:MAG: hypothetical protein AAF629_20310 [Chloroflexota bacterium]